MRISYAIFAGALIAAAPAYAAGTSIDLNGQTTADLSVYTGGPSYPAAGSTVTISGIDFTLAGYYPAYFNDPSVGVVQSDNVNPSLTVNFPGITLGTNTTFYSLINSAFGQQGQQIGNLTFNLLGGGSIVYTLTEGDNVRDHYNGQYNNVASNVYGTAVFGDDRLDAQQIVISSAYAGDVVTSVTLNNTNPGGGNPFLAALTFTDAATAVPELATWAMMIAGMAATGIALRRRQRPALAAA